MTATEAPPNNTFRLRGLETTRLDTFVDAAFAFGSTVLLISSGSLPSNYTQLLSLLADIPSFVLSFFTMMIFWLSHRNWSRRYGLENNWTIGFTLLLVVTLLVYIYPLKLMYTTLISFLSGGEIEGGIRFSSATQGVKMIGFYGFGFCFLSLAMVGLFVTAWRARVALALNDFEQLQTRIGITLWIILAATGLVSGLCALLLPWKLGVWSGMLYWLLAPGIPLALTILRRRHQQSTARNVA